MMSRASPQERLSRLAGAVEHMDGLSQEGFEQVAALSRLLLAGLEVPQTRQSREDVATVLGLIAETAGRYADYINSQAEEVGCNNVGTEAQKEHRARRMAAMVAEGDHA